MYDIMKKTDSISQILPQTVERLLALSDIHQQGIIIQQWRIYVRKKKNILKGIVFQPLPSVNL